VIHNIGQVFRPRRYEILQALTRIRGIKLKKLHTEIDDEDLRIKKKKAEEKKENVS
jgi:hypothetical protein